MDKYEIEKRREAVYQVDKLGSLADRGKLAELVALQELEKMKLNPSWKHSKNYDIILGRDIKNRIEVKGAKFRNEEGGCWWFSLRDMLQIKEQGFDYLIFVAFNEKYDVDRFFIFTLDELIRNLKLEKELPEDKDARFSTNKFIVTIYKDNKNPFIEEISEPEKKINKNIEKYENSWNKIKMMQ